jgi:hypothetical protein
MRIRIIARSTTLTALALLASARLVHAQCSAHPPTWTHTASSCAVDEASLTKYQFNNADFSFKGTETSDNSPSIPSVPLPIIVRCNVVNPLDSSVNPLWTTLRIGYQDPDGTGTGSRVRALLRRVHRPTGATTTLATFDSNSSPATTRREETADVSPIKFDFHSYEYFVQIELTRRFTGLSSNPLAFKARLELWQCGG